MLKNLKSLTGLPVLWKGKKLGRVVQASVSEDLRRLDGLWLDAGFFGTRFLPAEEISVMGEVSIVVTGRGRRKRIGKPPFFLRAVSTRGERLGAVTDAWVDEVSLLVEALELSSGIWDDFMHPRQKIRLFAPGRRNEVIVPALEEGKEEFLHA